MKLSELGTLYTRPEIRFTKIVALGILLDYIDEQGLQRPHTKLMLESLQPTGPGIYNLDCNGNGYRERGMNEVEVVMHDFSIPANPEYFDLSNLVTAHNVRDLFTHGANGLKQASTRNCMDLSHGSVSKLTGHGWRVTDQVKIGSPKWHKAMKEGLNGEPVLDINNKPIFYTVAQRDPLTSEDFLWMCVDVVISRIKAERTRRLDAQKAKDAWTKAQGLKSIDTLMSTHFQGKPIKAGNSAFPTLSGYVRDLVHTGTPLDQIRTELGRWLRLAQVIDDCFYEALSFEGETFRLKSDNLEDQPVGRIFDLMQVDGEKIHPLADNPVLHNAWLGDPNTYCVIVRSTSGHVAIFTRNMETRSIDKLAAELIRQEGEEIWSYEQGPIYNGSRSREHQKRTQFSVHMDGSESIPLLAQRYLKIRSFIPNRKYASPQKLAAR